MPTRPIAAALLLSLPVPAFAVECRTEAEDMLRQVRAGELVAHFVQQSDVTIERADGASVTMAPQESEPRENWFGDPPALKTAVEALEGARLEDNEEGCRPLLDDARGMLKPAD